MIIAGGTDVIFNMRGRLFQPDCLISIKDLPELRQVVERDDGGISVGAACRLTDLEVDPLVARYPGLVDGLRAVASRHVRNMATLGGNLNLDTRCWYTNQSESWRQARGPCLKTGVEACHAIRSSDICVALNASDVAPALIALDAQVELVSRRGTRRVPLDGYYTDDGIRHTVRQPDEMMAGVMLPPPAGRMVYLKETARKGNDFAYATLAVWADGVGSECNRVRAVFGSLTTRPVLLKDSMELISTLGLNDAAIAEAVSGVRAELGVLTNLYTPAAFKGRLARTLLDKALRSLRVI
jgi:4-hydroxybenzoyl-CoA reductase subunit beta